MMIIYVMFIL